MTDDASRPHGSHEPVVFDDDERQLLRAAYDPAPARVEAVKGALAARIAALAAAGAGASAASSASAAGAEAAANTGAAATTSAALGWSTAQWIGAGVLAAVVAGGAAVALRSPEPATTHEVAPAKRAVSASRALPQAAPALETKPARIEPPTALAPAKPAAAAPSVSEPQASPRTRKTPRGASAESAALQSAPAAKARADKASTSASTESASVPVAAEQPVAAAAAPAAAPALVAAPAPQLNESLARELSVLRKARAALERGSAPLALSLLDEYGALFPQGVLRQEELATRALALCAAGRAYEARKAARTLARLAPRSPHLIRLADSCALRETSTTDGEPPTDDR